MKYNSMLKEKKTEKNYEGARAYAMTPELELYTAVVTASLSDTFYEKQDERVDRIAQLIGKVSPEFIARLAVYARTEMHLRSIPLLLLVELAKIHNGDDLVARAVEKTVLRADEIMELLMCYQWRNPSGDARKKLGKLSRQIQNGLQRAFNRFDEYQFAKYDRNGLEVKLRDALFLVHPKAKYEQQQILFDKIVNRQLEDGVEGFTGAQITSPDLRAGAALVIAALQADGYSVIDDIIYILRGYEDFDGKLRSLGAEIEKVNSTHTTMLMNALEAAVKCSASNIEGFDENTRVLLASDVSRSMWSPISQRSTIRNYDIGILLSMLLRSRCKQVVAGVFGNDWKVVNMPNDNVLMATRQLERLGNTVGFSTNGYKVINWLMEQNIVMDKVMMFTDMQMWDSTGRHQEIEDSWRKYKKMAPNAKLYLFDLAGYGQLPMRLAEPDVYLIAGWSDRVFDILSAIDKGEDALIVINHIEI